MNVYKKKRTTPLVIVRGVRGNNHNDDSYVNNDIYSAKLGRNFLTLRRSKWPRGVRGSNYNND